MKAIKITPYNIKQINNINDDIEYTGNILNGLLLDLPLKWKFNKYILTMFTKDIYTSDDIYNPLATYLYSKLKCNFSDNIFGSVFICAEDNDSIIDFTINDLNYLIAKIKIL